MDKRSKWPTPLEKLFCNQCRQSVAVGAVASAVHGASPLYNTACTLYCPGQRQCGQCLSAVWVRFTAESGRAVVTALWPRSSALPKTSAPRHALDWRERGLQQLKRTIMHRCAPPPPPLPPPPFHFSLFSLVRKSSCIWEQLGMLACVGESYCPSKFVLLKRRGRRVTVPLYLILLTDALSLSLSISPAPLLLTVFSEFLFIVCIFHSSCMPGRWLCIKLYSRVQISSRTAIKIFFCGPCCRSHSSKQLLAVCVARGTFL